MTPVPRLQKLVGILLISLLLIPFALGAAAEIVAAKYAVLVLLIAFLAIIVVGFSLYLRRKKMKPADVQAPP